MLRQCIHNGFGIHRFGEDLTGTQYAKRLIDRVTDMVICAKTDTIVLGVSKERIITATSRRDGLKKYKAKAVIIATGCRERARGALLLPGSRPAGVMTAGTAQKYMNIDGYLVGKRIVILGSGDIGLIMARQFVLEGAQVIAVAEIMPYSGGLIRNIVQCLDDFDIPLYYNTTVARIVGTKRVEGVYLADVDSERMPIASTERFITCDTLVLSVGLIPENELAFDAGLQISSVTGGPVVDDALQTETDGIFACGNALHVHDLVDFVSIESEIAGRNAAQHVSTSPLHSRTDDVICTEEGFGVRGVVPQRIHTGSGDNMVKIQFRPARKFSNSFVAVYSGDDPINRKRHRVLTPGEMCTIEVNKADIKTTLRIEIEPKPDDMC